VRIELGGSRSRRKSKLWEISFFNVLAFGAGGPSLEIGARDRHGVPRALPSMTDADLTHPVLAVGFGDHRDHRKKPIGRVP
jgi:hypothetical protein